MTSSTIENINNFNNNNMEQELQEKGELVSSSSTSTSAGSAKNQLDYSYSKFTFLFNDPKLEEEYVLFAFPGRIVVSIILASVSCLFIFVPSFYSLPVWALALDIIGCVCCVFAGGGHYYHVHNREKEIPQDRLRPEDSAGILIENHPDGDDRINHNQDRNNHKNVSSNIVYYTQGISRYLVSRVEEYALVTIFTYAMILQAVIMYVKYEGCVEKYAVENPSAVPSCSNYVDHYLIIVVESFAVIAPARAVFVVPLTLLALLILGLSYFWSGQDIVTGTEHGVRVGVEIVMSGICLTACIIREWAMRSLFVLHASAEKDRDAAASLQTAARKLLDSTLPREVTEKIAHHQQNSPKTSSPLRSRRGSVAFIKNDNTNVLGGHQDNQQHQQPIASMWDIDRAHASIFYSDIAGFTSWCSTLEPKAVVSTLASIISQLDALTLKIGVTKIKTIGDAFCAVAGLPSVCSHPGTVMALFALHAQKVFISHEKEREESFRKNPAATVPAFRGFRIGVATGRVTGALMGSQIVSYEVIGSVNNLAQKMEANAPLNGILVCEKTKDAVNENYNGSFDFEEFSKEIELLVAATNVNVKSLPSNTNVTVSEMIQKEKEQGQQSSAVTTKKKKAFVLTYRKKGDALDKITNMILSAIRANDGGDHDEESYLVSHHQEMKKNKNKKKHRRVGVSDIEEGQDSVIDEDQAREDALLMNRSPSGAASDGDFMNRPLSHVSVTSMVSEGGTTTGVVFPAAAPSSISQNTNTNQGSSRGNIQLPHALSPTSGGNSYSRSSAKSLETAAQNAMMVNNNIPSRGDDEISHPVFSDNDKTNNDNQVRNNIHTNNPDDVIVFSSASDKSEGRLSKIADNFQHQQQKPSSTDIISDRTESTYSEPTYTANDNNMNNTANSSTTPTGSMRHMRAISGMNQQQQQGNPNASIGVTSASFGEGNSSLTALAGGTNPTANRRLTIKNLLNHDRNERAKLKRKHNKLKMLRKGISANPDYFGPGTLNENTNNNPLVMSAAVRKMLKKKQNKNRKNHPHGHNNSSSSVSTSSDDDDDIDVDDELGFIEKQQHVSDGANKNHNTNNYKRLIIDVEEDEDEGNYENEAIKLEDQLSDLAHEFNPDTLRKALAPRFVTDSYEEEFTRYGRRSELLPFRVIGIQITGLIALLIGVQWGVYGRGTDEAIAIMFTALVLSIVFVFAMIFFGDKECGAGGQNNGEGIDDDDLFDNESSASSAIYENVEREVLRLRRNTFGSVPRTTLLLTVHYFAAGLTIIGTSLWGETYLSRGVLYLRFVCAVIKGSITSIPSWWGVIHDLVFPVGATAFAVGYRTPQNEVEERRRIEEIIFLVAGLYVGWLCRLSNELSNKNNFMSMRRNELSSKLLRARREAALEVVQMAIPRRYCPEILRKNVAYQDAIKQAAEERREKLRRIAEEAALREDEQQTMNSNNKNDRRNRHRNRHHQRFTSNSTSATNGITSPSSATSTHSFPSSSHSSGATNENNTTQQQQQQQQLSQYSSATNQDGALLMKFSVVHEMKNASIAFIDLTATVADDVFLLQFILSKLESFLEKFNHELRRRIKSKNNNNSNGNKSSSSTIFGDCFVTKIKTVGSILMCAALPVGSSAENDENCNTELALYHFVIEALYYLNHTIQREVPQLFMGTSNQTLRSLSVDPQNNNNNNFYSYSSQSESASRLRMEGIKEIASLRSVGGDSPSVAAADSSNKSTHDNIINHDTLPPPPLQRENTAIGGTLNPDEQQKQQHLQVPSVDYQTQRRRNSNLSANTNTSTSASAGAAFLQQQHQLQALSTNQIRCGLHSGSVIGCVLGQERLSFDCLGSTVNQASRCMSTGEQGDTTMTTRFYSRLVDQQKRYDTSNNNNVSQQATKNNEKLRTDVIASKLLLLNQQQQDATTNSSSMKKREMKGLGAVDVFVILNESI